MARAGQVHPVHLTSLISAFRAPLIPRVIVLSPYRNVPPRTHHLWSIISALLRDVPAVCVLAASELGQGTWVRRALGFYILLGDSKSL